jgi:quinol monooxygenase YgiN
MLIVAGSMTTAPEDRDEVMRLAQSVMHATRREEGCHEYVFTADSQDPGLIRLYERWEGDDQLTAHLETAHIAQWRETAGPLITGRDIKIFTISESRDLP